MPWIMLSVGIVVFLVQPAPQPEERGTILAIAGLAGVALSLGFAVALLVAQHTAERHARLMFAEFRADRTWPITLGSFAVGVAMIVAAAIWRPSISTMWASFFVLIWLGLMGARAFPHLLDSLDPVVLAQRVAQRSASRLLKAAPQGLLGGNQELAIDAERGVTACATVAAEALSNQDTDVFESAVRGLVQILVAYLRRSPWVVPTDRPVDLAFQRIDVLAAEVAQRSQVILMPTLIAELRELGTQGVAIAKTNPRGNDVVSLRLNMVLFGLIAASMRNQASVAPSFATSTMADVGVGLVAVGLAAAVRDHIDKLSAVALAGIDAGADHVAAPAVHGLARIAAGIVESDARDVMLAQRFRLTCEAIADALARHVARKDRSLIGEMSVLPVIGPLAAPSLPILALGAAQRAASGDSLDSMDFGLGADRLLSALADMAAADDESATARSDALECLYSAAAGVLAISLGDPESAERIDHWIERLSNVILEDERSGQHTIGFAPEKLASVLLFAAYAIPEACPEVADRLRLRIRTVAEAIGAAPTGFARRRLVGALIPMAVALIGSGEETLVTELAAATREDLQERVGAGRGGQFEASTLMPGIPRPHYAATHRSDEGLALLQEFLDQDRDKHRSAT
jgi:hypothetical protein